MIHPQGIFLIQKSKATHQSQGRFLRAVVDAVLKEEGGRQVDMTSERLGDVLRYQRHTKPELGPQLKSLELGQLGVEPQEQAQELEFQLEQRQELRLTQYRSGSKFLGKRDTSQPFLRLLSQVASTPKT